MVEHLPSIHEALGYTHRITQKIYQKLMKTGHSLNLYKVLGSIPSTHHMYTCDLIYCDVDYKESLD